MRRAPATLLLSVLLLLLLLPGCGGEDGPSPEDEVKAAVTDFARASQKRDYRRICDRLLAASLRETLQRAGLPCELALREGLSGVEQPRVTVLAVEVDGEAAAARVRSEAEGQRPSTDTIELVRERGAWRIADLAAPGPPTP